MKAMRKILPALCMLLVSAVLLGSTTYAWFSANTTVEATGMQLTAESATSLFISNTAGYADNTFKASVVFTNEYTANSKVSPVDYEDLDKLKVGTFYGLNEEQIKDVDASGKVSDAVLTEAKKNTTDMEKNVFKETFKLKLTSTNAKKITVAPSFTGDMTKSPAIYKAVHVVLVNSNSDAEIDFDMGETTIAEKELIASMSNGVSEEWTVYAFVKGSDDDCKNDNALSELTFSIKLTFTVDEIA